MLDSYKAFIDNFNISKDDLYKYGIESIISADYDTAKDQYIQVKDKLFRNEKLCIRGYGRNGANSNLFLELYKFLFENSNICVDPTNNAAPRKNISSATGYQINHNLFNYQVSHIWGKTKNPILFESIWNICFVPRLYDPFTGHECKGDWNEEFIPLLNHSIYDKFEKLIVDYNQLVMNRDIRNKINKFADDLLSTNKYASSLIERFRVDALSEWEIISRL